MVLLREAGVAIRHGLRIVVDSQVPEGKGLSSSAAIEVATLRAVAALCGIELAGEEIRDSASWPRIGLPAQRAESWIK